MSTLATDAAVQPSVVDAVTIRRVSTPIDPPMVSGGHHVASVDVNLVAIASGAHVGLGYTFAFSAHEAASVTPLIQHLAEPLVQEPVAAVRAHWRSMWKRINFIGRAGPPVMALSAIDTALWDLHARCLGVPLATLLGLPRRRLPLYGAGGWLSFDRDELIDEALRFQCEGYGAYKMRAGGADWREDVQRVKDVRAAVGPEMALMVDVNQAWDVNTAVRAAQALEDVDLRWLEEPVDAEHFGAMAAVRARAPMPIAAGETVYGTKPFEAMIEAGSIDTLQPDLMRCGGVTGFLEVAALARGAGLGLASHLFSEVSAHLMPLAGAGGLVEHLPGWFDTLFAGAPALDRGHVMPTARPGLGIELDAETMRTSIVEEVSL